MTLSDKYMIHINYLKGVAGTQESQTGGLTLLLLFEGLYSRDTEP